MTITTRARKSLIIIGILGIGVAGFATLVKTRPKPPPVQPQEQSWVVQIQAIEPQTLAPTLTLSGRVESPHAAHLTAAVAADVQAVPAREGMTVRKGQMLVQLDERELGLAVQRREADLKEVEARLASEDQRHDSDLTALKHEDELLRLGRAQLERNRDVASKKLAPQLVVDQAQQEVERLSLTVEARRLAVADHAARRAALEAQRQRAESELAQARLDLARTRILAPFDGRVAKVTLAPGDRVAQGTPAVEIYDTGALEVRAQLPAPHLPTVRAALAQGGSLRAHVEVDGQAIEVVLDRLAAQVNKGSAGVDGLFRALSANTALALGRYVELFLVLPPARDVIALPPEALYGLNRIYTLRDGRMVGLSVEVVGERRDAAGGGRILVRSPALKHGDAVIVTQLPNAMNGLKVQVAKP